MSQIQTRRGLLSHDEDQMKPELSPTRDSSRNTLVAMVDLSNQADRRPFSMDGNRNFRIY